MLKKAAIGVICAASLFAAGCKETKAEPVAAYVVTDLFASVLVQQTGLEFFPFSSFYDRGYRHRRSYWRSSYRHHNHRGRGNGRHR